MRRIGSVEAKLLSKFANPSLLRRFAVLDFASGHGAHTAGLFAQAAAAHGIRLEVVKLPQAKHGFVLLPRRWVVRFRRLARADLEEQRFPILRLLGGERRFPRHPGRKVVADAAAGFERGGDAHGEVEGAATAAGDVATRTMRSIGAPASLRTFSATSDLPV